MLLDGYKMNIYKKIPFSFARLNKKYYLCIAFGKTAMQGHGKKFS